MNSSEQQQQEQNEIKEREIIFNEFKQKYFDIIDEVPLELGRKLSLISQLETSLQECKRELHEDLIEYTRFAKSVTIDGTDSNPAASSSSNQPDHPGIERQDDDDDDEQTMKNELLVLAQPTLWGVVKIPTFRSESDRRERSALPKELRTLLMEISEKMNKLTQLSRDKLELSESIYLQLDLQLKRLDNDLEAYHDLEEQDVRLELVPQHSKPSQQDPSNTAVPSKQNQEPNLESESPSRSSRNDSRETKDYRSYSSTPKAKRTVTIDSCLTPTTSDTNRIFNSSNDHTPIANQASPCKTQRVLRSTTTSPTRRSTTRT